jgi:hypothetical protein
MAGLLCEGADYTDFFTYGSNAGKQFGARVVIIESDPTDTTIITTLAPNS